MMNCLIYMNPNFTLSCKLILDPSYLILSSLKKGELNLDMETCFFCGISASNEVTLEKCQHCNLVSYCCQRHEKLHRPKNICYPVRIERHPTKGKNGFRHELFYWFVYLIVSKYNYLQSYFHHYFQVRILSQHEISNHQRILQTSTHLSMVRTLSLLSLNAWNVIKFLKRSNKKTKMATKRPRKYINIPI